MKMGKQMRLPSWVMILIMVAVVASFSKQDAKGSDAGLTPQKRSQFVSADPSPEAVRGDHPMVYPMNNLNWLTSNSPFIFVGRVIAASAEKDARGLVITRNQFAVEKVIAGDLKTKVVTLTTLGGAVNGDTMTVSNMPEFRANQTYVVFTDLKRTVYNPITGNRNGVFLVNDDSVYTYEGQALVSVKDGLLRVSDVTLQRLGKERNREEAAPVYTDPNTSGLIVSVERAAAGAEKPMRLETFLKVILTATRQ